MLWTLVGVLLVIVLLPIAVWVVVELIPLLLILLGFAIVAALIAWAWFTHPEWIFGVLLSGVVGYVAFAVFLIVRAANRRLIGPAWRWASARFDRIEWTERNVMIALLLIAMASAAFALVVSGGA